MPKYFFLICFVFSLLNTSNMIGQNSNSQQHKKKMSTISEKVRTQDDQDVKAFAKGYAQAWCSQKSDFVAYFYAENGSLSINDGTPSVGRIAITQSVKAFMDAFPDDMIVTFDKLITSPKGIEFHWTLTGTNTGPNGTGKKVNISGFELWQMDDNGLIKESKGNFDEVEYMLQLNEGLKD
jgi:hypothetical protein